MQWIRVGTLLVLAVGGAGKVTVRRDPADHEHHHRHHHRHHRHHSKAGTSETKAVASETEGALANHALANHVLANHAVPSHPAIRHMTTRAKLKSTDTSEVVKKVAHPPPNPHLVRPASAPKLPVMAAASDTEIMSRLDNVERLLSSKEKASSMTQGHLEVNGPLPPDFPDRFALGVASATGCAPDGIRVLGAKPTHDEEGHLLDEVVFEARGECVEAVQRQSTDASSPLANGPLRVFLVARGGDGDDAADEAADAGAAQQASAVAPAAAAEAPAVDASAMPYGDLEPFGREDTAQELTESSIRESDAMVDQLERAEVAEEKRAVFRALTRLRGAAITSFDGIARSQTGNIDEYAKKYQWRKQNPVKHLSQEEADYSRWAFPVSN